MKFLFDENVSYRIVKKIENLANDSIHVSKSGLKMPASDRMIWRFAKDYGFVLVSFDEDFQDLSHLYGFPPKVILFRMGNLTTQEIAEIMTGKWQEIVTFFQSDVQGLLEIF